jgi:16S rRNA (guanine527-N7)-methyltransferase
MFVAERPNQVATGVGKERFRKEMLRLGVDVSRETEDRLEIIVRTVERWQRAVNLVARSTLSDIWFRHLLDSAQLVPLLPRYAHSLTDLGSGGGFPGLVLAALRPDLDITLIDSDARKGAYLAEAARRMILPKLPRIVTGRIETVPPAKADVVTARAVAPLRQLLFWAVPHRNDPAICLFHKGKGWQGELTEARQDWDIEAQLSPSVTDRDAVLLSIADYRAKDLRDR